jgi:excisionase family DNA binding protein
LTHIFHGRINREIDFLTTERAAEKLGVTPRRVQAAAKAGRSPAGRFGGALTFRESDLALVADPTEQIEEKATKKRTGKKTS